MKCANCGCPISFTKEERIDRLIGGGEVCCLLCFELFSIVFRNRWLKLCQTLWECEQRHKRKIMGLSED